MKYRFLALDLDGTLLDRQYRIPSSTQKALKAVQDRGVVITLATGRMWNSAKYYADLLGLNHPLVVYNGAVVRCMVGGEMLYEKALPLEAMRQLAEFCKQRGLYLQLYRDNVIVVEKLRPETIVDPDFAHAPYIEVGDLTASLALRNSELTPSPKMMIRFLPGTTVDIASLQSDVMGCIPNVTAVQSSSLLLEILSEGTSKGTALQFLSEKLSINPEEVMAIGDGDNDITMVAWAGLGVAVQNSSPELKRVANYVAVSPAYLGVEEAIDKFILQRP